MRVPEVAGPAAVLEQPLGASAIGSPSLGEGGAEIDPHTYPTSTAPFPPTLTLSLHPSLHHAHTPRSVLGSRGSKGSRGSGGGGVPGMVRWAPPA